MRKGDNAQNASTCYNLTHELVPYACGITSMIAIQSLAAGSEYLVDSTNLLNICRTMSIVAREVNLPGSKKKHIRVL